MNRLLSGTIDGIRIVKSKNPTDGSVDEVEFTVHAALGAPRLKELRIGIDCILEYDAPEKSV